MYTEFEPLSLRLRFTEAHRRYWRNCERDARHAPVVGLVPVAVEQVSRDDFAVVARHRRQRRTAARRIACRIDLWVGYALKKLVELQPTLFGHDIGRGQIERVKVGCATGGMHDQIGSHRLHLSIGRGMHEETICRLIDPLHRRPCAYLDAEFSEFLHKPTDQIRIEGWK